MIKTRNSRHIENVYSVISIILMNLRKSVSRHRKERKCHLVSCSQGSHSLDKWTHPSSQSQIAALQKLWSEGEKTNCLNCTVKIVKLTENDAATKIFIYDDKEGRKWERTSIKTFFCKASSPSSNLMIILYSKRFRNYSIVCKNE